MNKKFVIFMAKLLLVLICIEPKKTLLAMHFAEHDLVTIQTRDLQEFLLPIELVKTSKTLANLIEDAGTDNPLPLPNISGKIWQLVQDELADIVLINHQPSHKKKYKKQISTHLRALASNQLIAFIAGVNYLDIPLLLKYAQSEIIKRDPALIHKNDLLSLPKDLRNPIVKTHILKLEGPITQTRHHKINENKASLSSICITPDNKSVVSGCSDGTISMLDIHTGNRLATLRGHTSCVTSVRVTPDGKKIVSGSGDKTIRIWDINTCKQLAILNGHPEYVKSVCITPDGQKIVSCGPADRERFDSLGDILCVWDINTRKQIIKEYTKFVNSVCVTPDGKKIVSGSGDRTIRIWDINTGKQLTIFKGVTNPVCSVCVTPDGNKIIFGTWDDTDRDDTSRNNVIYICDISTGKLFTTLQGHTDKVKSVCVTPDGKKVVSGSLDRTIRIWDIITGKQLAILQWHEHTVKYVSVTPDGSKIVSGSKDRTIRIWDILLSSYWTNGLNREQLIFLWPAIQEKDISTIHKIRNTMIQPTHSACAVM